MKLFEGRPKTKGVEKPVSEEERGKAAAEKEAAEWELRLFKLRKRRKELETELLGVEADVAHLNGMRREGRTVEEADRYLRSK